MKPHTSEERFPPPPFVKTLPFTKHFDILATASCREQGSVVYHPSVAIRPTEAGHSGSLETLSPQPPWRHRSPPLSGYWLPPSSWVAACLCLPLVIQYEYKSICLLLSLSHLNYLFLSLFLQARPLLLHC